MNRLRPWLLPALALGVCLWLMSGIQWAPAPAITRQTQYTGPADGKLSAAEFSLLMDSAVVGLYDEYDSLLFAGTKLQMEAYLRAYEEWYESVPADSGEVLPYIFPAHLPYLFSGGPPSGPPGTGKVLP